MVLGLAATLPVRLRPIIRAFLTLQEKAMGPATITMQEETFESVGGIHIHLRSWQPGETARAVVVICHGVNSHGGQYTSAGEQFAEAGFATFALDLRGRGKSEGERF